MVYPAALLPLMRTPRLPVVDWTDVLRRFKLTRPFRRKTNSGFCACAITFQLASTTERRKSFVLSWDSPWTMYQSVSFTWFRVPSAGCLHFFCNEITNGRNFESHKKFAGRSAIWKVLQTVPRTLFCMRCDLHTNVTLRRVRVTIVAVD